MIEPGVTIPIKRLQNMNFEHHRPQISQSVIDTFTRLVDEQDAKGIAKYGMTIDDASDEQYEWLRMALEEAVDLAKYQNKEIEKLRKEIHRLRTDKSRIFTQKVLEENLDLSKEVETLKAMITYLEARLNHGAK